MFLGVWSSYSRIGRKKTMKMLGVLLVFVLAQSVTWGCHGGGVEERFV